MHGQWKADGHPIIDKIIIIPNQFPRDLFPYQRFIEVYIDLN
jgi:hypothetical protein